MITWKVEKGMFASSLVGRLGRVKVFSVARSISRNKGISLHCSLPGATDIYDCDTEESAKEKAEEILKGWLKAAGLKQEEAA